MEKIFLDVFREKYQGADSSLQESLHELKKMGCTQAQAAKLVMKELHVSLKEADEIVLNSKAWAQEKEATLKIRNSFEDGLSE